MGRGRFGGDVGGDRGWRMGDVFVDHTSGMYHACTDTCRAGISCSLGTVGQVFPTEDRNMLQTALEVHWQGIGSIRKCVVQFLGQVSTKSPAWEQMP